MSSSISNACSNCVWVSGSVYNGGWWGRTSWSAKSLPTALNAARSRSIGEDATAFRRVPRFFLMFLAQVAASCRCLLTPLSLVAVHPVSMRAESFLEAIFTVRMLAFGSSCGGESGVTLCFSLGFEIASFEASWRVKSSTSSAFFVVLAARVLTGRLEVEAFGGM